MTTKVLVDMNLSPEWVPLLIGCGFEAIHWSTVGNPRARDTEIVVFTHDLDFAATLALTHAAGPSVLQLRGRAVLPENVSAPVVATLRRYETELMAGALVVVEENRSRVRILPL